MGSGACLPTHNDKPTLSPSTAATLAVAALLFAAAFLYAGAAHDFDPEWLFRLGSAGAAAVLLLRAIGDRRTIGLTKRVRGTTFARYDDRVFTPLCIALAVSGFITTAG